MYAWNHTDLELTLSNSHHLVLIPFRQYLWNLQCSSFLKWWIIVITINRHCFHGPFYVIRSAITLSSYCQATGVSVSKLKSSCWYHLAADLYTSGGAWYAAGGFLPGSHTWEQVSLPRTRSSAQCCRNSSRCFQVLTHHFKSSKCFSGRSSITAWEAGDSDTSLLLQKSPLKTRKRLLVACEEGMAS